MIQSRDKEKEDISTRVKYILKHYAVPEVMETRDIPDDKVEDYIHEAVYLKSENSGIQGALMNNVKKIVTHVKNVSNSNFKDFHHIC